MSQHAGIETLDFSFDGRRAAGHFAPVLVGVVGSGNLEVLLEPDASPACVVHVETSAHGFRPIWQAVLDDFHTRHALAGVRLSINDMGATPAVVSLRLDQAVADWAQAGTSAAGAHP
jgi:malonate decarboxylase delta subunit